MTPSTERVCLYLTIFLITINLMPSLLYDAPMPSLYALFVICIMSTLISTVSLITFQIVIFILMAVWDSHHNYCDGRVDLVASYRNQ